MDAPNALINKTRAYVEEVLGTPLELVPSDVGEALPFFMRDRYAFLQGELLGQRCLFAAPHDDFDKLEAPANLARQFHQIAGKSNAVVVLLLPTLAAYNRKRLIAQRINFIVAGAQLFLPELAVDLREYHRHALAQTRPPVETLSPTAQMIVLDALLHGNVQGQIAKAIAKSLTVSAMAVGRALDELRAVQLVLTDPPGAGFRLYFKAYGRELWDLARPMLASPVRKVRGVVHAPRGPGVFLAGESALARYTSLDEPPRMTVAMHDKDWKGFASEDLELLETGRGAPFVVETWSYPPGPLARSPQTVDPLSLYLSLSQHEDRMAIAADDLLNGVFQ